MILKGQILPIGGQKYRVHFFKCPDSHMFTILTQTGVELGNDEGLPDIPASSVGCVYFGCNLFAQLVTDFVD